MARLLLLLIGFTAGSASMAEQAPMPYLQRAEVQAWMEQLTIEHQFPAEELRALIGSVEHQPEVIAHASRPAESMSWHRYRKIFLTEARTTKGRDYIEQHAALFEAAERDYGIPTEIIAAIIGVESNYGQNTGKYKVLDTLMTLGFDYPPRAKFFRGQITHLLLLGREAGLDIRGLRGSWAGAMGLGQFIPSSYRDFTVDGDGDGKRDLWDSPADIIESIANYFHQHQWQVGQPIGELLTPEDPDLMPLSDGLLPRITLQQLQAANVQLSHPQHVPVSVRAFDIGDQMEYWAGYKNFYVITRYNHSALYALAVFQLSETLHDAPDS